MGRQYGLKKQSINPKCSESITGDLWVDTDQQQLYPSQDQVGF